MALLGPGLTATVAAASPVFVAEHPEDVALAEAAWEAATQCTGWEGAHHPKVEILRGPMSGGYQGLAYGDEAGLYRIEIGASEDRRAEVIVHEVAHAWVSDGPTTLAEGRTELLADCIVSRRPGLAPLQWDDGRPLDEMPDLRTWHYQDDHGPARMANERTDAYLGASRLVRVAALVVSERELWPRAPMDWVAFDALMRGAGEPGARLVATLDGGPAVQREALSDADRDGLPHLAEKLVGSDPDRWDTDDDGWWDGSVLDAIPARSVALPFDGTPVCSGLAGSPLGGTAHVVGGGHIRGSDLPTPYLLGAPSRAEGVPVAAHAPIVVDLSTSLDAAAGGIWADVRGVGLVPDMSCVNTARLSVWATEPHLVGFAPEFARRLGVAVEEADARWGEMPGRFGVQLGGGRTLFEDDVVYLSTEEIERAEARGKLADLVHVSATVPRCWRNGDPDWRVAEALAQALARPAAGPGDTRAGGR